MLGLASTATQRNSGNIFFSTCLATLLHCKLKLVRITAFMANLSQQNSVTSLRNSTHIIGQSCVITLLSNNLAFRRTSTSGLHFLLNFPCRRRKRSVFSDNWAKSCIFVAVFSSLLPLLLLVLKWQQGAPKTMKALEVYIQGKLMTFRELLVYFETRLVRLQCPPCLFVFLLLFAALPRFATGSHKGWIQTCCQTNCSFSGNTSSKNKICCRK